MSEQPVQSHNETAGNVATASDVETANSAEPATGVGAAGGRLTLARGATLVGYFSLLAVLLNWFIWISPPVQVPRALLIIVLVVPLLLPMRGLLHGRRRSHQWMSFLSLFYFLIGVDVWFNYPPPDQWLGALTVLSSLVLFIGVIYAAKYLGPPRRPKRS